MLLAACSRLPDYAAPQGRIVDPAEVSSADIIPYRTLSPADFCARDLPAHANTYARKIGALTCARLDELVERHRQFDEETSGVYDPKRQHQWFERLTRQLEGI